MSKIKDCKYDSILISDHAPNSLCYVDPGLKKDQPKWRLQQKWLQDPDLISFLLLGAKLLVLQAINLKTPNRN